MVRPSLEQRSPGAGFEPHAGRLPRGHRRAAPRLETPNDGLLSPAMACMTSRINWKSSPFGPVGVQDLSAGHDERLLDQEGLQGVAGEAIEARHDERRLRRRTAYTEPQGSEGSFSLGGNEPARELAEPVPYRDPGVALRILRPGGRLGDGLAWHLSGG